LEWEKFAQRVGKNTPVRALLLHPPPAPTRPAKLTALFSLAYSCCKIFRLPAEIGMEIASSLLSRKPAGYIMHRSFIVSTNINKGIME
jgi:hypothetical protein